MVKYKENRCYLVYNLQHLHHREGLTPNNVRSLPSGLGDVNIGFVITRSAIKAAP